jgi:arginine repressor
LLPDLLAFRAKGYTSTELADIMRENGFTIAAATLVKYIKEARALTTRRRKKNKTVVATETKAITVKSGSRTTDATAKMVTSPSLLSTKPLAQNRRAAKDVLGHRFDYDV